MYMSLAAAACLLSSLKTPPSRSGSDRYQGSSSSRSSSSTTEAPMSCSIFSGAAATVQRSRMALAWRPCATARMRGGRVAEDESRSPRNIAPIAGARFLGTFSGVSLSGVMVRGAVRCFPPRRERPCSRSRSRPSLEPHGLLVVRPTAQSQGSSERRALRGALGFATAPGLPEEGRQRQLAGDTRSILPVH